MSWPHEESADSPQRILAARHRGATSSAITDSSQRVVRPTGGGAPLRVRRIVAACKLCNRIRSPCYRCEIREIRAASAEIIRQFRTVAQLDRTPGSETNANKYAHLLPRVPT